MEENEVVTGVASKRLDDDFLILVLLDFEARLGARKTTPKGMTYGDVLEALTTSSRIRTKLG